MRNLKVSKGTALVIFAVVALVTTIMMLPIPIKAKILEGEGPVPEPAYPMYRIFKVYGLNLSVTLENSTFVFEIDGRNHTFVTESVEVTILTTLDGNRTEVRFCLRMRNCYLTSPTFEVYVNLLDVYIEAVIEEGYCRYYCYGTTHMPVYRIIYNAIINL